MFVILHACNYLEKLNTNEKNNYEIATISETWKYKQINGSLIQIPELTTIYGTSSLMMTEGKIMLMKTHASMS